MIWFTWRQFRTQAWVTAGILAAFAVLLAITGHSIAQAYADANVAACHGDCAAAIDSFLKEARNGTSGTVYNLATLVMYVVPALIGIFWGAPLIARELEVGTHRLAWNQSVTRTRWLATKLAIVGGAAAATTGLLSWAVTAWAHHIDHATNDRITPELFGARDIVPVGYALFALTLGVTLGMLIHRTVPAMAATLAGHVAVAASMPLWIRAHLLPATHTTPPLDTSSPMEFTINQNGQMRLLGENPLPGSWLLTNRTITPAGKLFTGPTDPQFCGPEHGPQSCLRWAGTLGLRQDITYQPANHFWPLQWAETGVLLAVAVLLAGFCFWWTRRRLA
jgi:hypothetical protein